MSAPSQQISGIMSGMDTQSIVEQLMKIEKQPYDKLDIKKQTEQLRLQAFQAVNSMLLKFKSSVSNLASQKLWKAKSATSSNESSLTATASQYAVNGTYSFRVAQMATSTQYMSKGFSDTKATFGKADANGVYASLGSINIASGKTRVDTSAKLESLNGGKGVYRGSIRITDSRGNSGVVDLSGCETINDVVATINNSSGALVHASIGRNDNGDSFLQLTDTAGGAGALKVQNVGQGTTAKDLGLLVDASPDGKTISGKDIYYLDRDSYVSELNDGLGIEQGKISIYVDNAGAKGAVEIDLNSAKTVGDILDSVNAALAANPTFGDLRLGLNAGKNGFEFTGAANGATYVVYNSWEAAGNAASNPQLAEQLGLAGSFIGDASGVIKGERVLGDVDSPLLKNLNGAAGTGIGAAGTAGQARVPYPGGLSGATPAAYLNNGKGITVGAGLVVTLTEGNGSGLKRTLGNILGDNASLQALINAPGTTLQQVLDEINTRINSYATNPDMQCQALEGVKLVIKDGGVVFEGVPAGQTLNFAGELADSLGLNRTFDGKDLLSDPMKEAMAELYKSQSLRQGNEELLDNTKLGAMKAIGGTGAIKDTEDPGAPGTVIGIKAYIPTTGAFKVRVGSEELDLSTLVQGFTDDTTAGEFFDAINGALKLKFGAEAPYLTYNYLATGFQWGNVDLGQDFEVTGDLADALGASRNFSPPAGDVGLTVTDSVKKNLNPTMPGYATSLYPLDATKIQNIKLNQLNSGNGLSLAGDPGDALTITFSKDNADITLSVTKQQILDKMTSLGISDPSQASILEYYSSINAAIADQIAATPELGSDATFKIGCNEYGLTILNAYGNEAGETIRMGGELVMNGTWGLGNSPALSETPTTEHNVPLSYLFPVDITFQEVQGLGYITIKYDGVEKTLSTAGLGKDSTLRDLMDKLNSELAANNITGVSFTYNSAGTGLAIENESSKALTIVNAQDANTLARDLGLVSGNAGVTGGGDRVVAANSFSEFGSLGRTVVARSTKLSSLAGAKTLDVGSLNLTNTTGATMRLDISECKTVGDLVDAINSLVGFGIKASINETGDGVSLEEYWEPGSEPANDKRTTNLKVEDYGSGNVASILGIAGTGQGYWGAEIGYAQQPSSLRGSINKSLAVSGSDTLESIMNRLSELGYKTAIINDGSGANPYRLTVSSATTGEAADFILDSNLEFLGLAQSSRGRDAKVLYGNPDSGVSPIMLSSATNSNSSAILGLTLDIKGVSSTYTTITVDTDKSKVVEEFKNLAQTYNDLNDLVSYLDGYDPETNEKGVLFGDNNLRTLMKTIDDMFYQVYNPGGYAYGEKTEKTSWTWMDFGISFGTNQTNAATGKTGSAWYSTMELDTEALESMVAANWDTLFNAMASQTNRSNSKSEGKSAATASFNFQHDIDPVTGMPIIPAGESNPAGAINNDYTTSMANGNGFTANKSINQGENQYTVFFQGNVTISRMSIYHADSVFIPGYGTGNGALKDFTVEYLDANTGKWETFREIGGNTSNANHLGVAAPVTAQAVRITANSTNAADGKFRLLDLQVFEDTGLAGKLNQVTTALGDVTTGFMAERTTEIENQIKEIEEQMARIQEKLDMKEASLWRQFTAMETALGKLQNQGNQLSQMLGTVSGKK